MAVDLPDGPAPSIEDMGDELSDVLGLLDDLIESFVEDVVGGDYE